MAYGYNTRLSRASLPFGWIASRFIFQVPKTIDAV